MVTAPYGMLLAIILLGVLLKGSKFVYNESPKEKSDVIRLTFHVFSDFLIAGSIFALFFLAR